MIRYCRMKGTLHDLKKKEIKRTWKAENLENERYCRMKPLQRAFTNPIFLILYRKKFLLFVNVYIKKQ
jgi:hypothetical protein